MREAGSECEPPEDDTVVFAERWKAEHFVRQLGAKPFVCFVISNDQVLVFEKDVNPDGLRKIQEAITELIQED